MGVYRKKVTSGQYEADKGQKISVRPQLSKRGTGGRDRTPNSSSV